MKTHTNLTRNQTLIYKAVYELINILYDHLNCDESDLEDCETLEELLECISTS